MRETNIVDPSMMYNSESIYNKQISIFQIFNSIKSATLVLNFATNGFHISQIIITFLYYLAANIQRDFISKWHKIFLDGCPEIGVPDGLI